MIIVVLVLILLIGMVFSLCIKPELGSLELSGISFPMGLGIWSVMLWMLDLAGIAINNKVSLVLACILILSALSYFLLQKKHKIIFNSEISNWIKTKPLRAYLNNPWKINPFYVLLFVLVSFIVFTIVSKTLYWPIFNYDSINGYDLIAKVIGSEGQYNNSVFSSDNPMHTIRSFYPPLLVHALSISYIFGAGHSKITAVIFLLSTILTLYALVLKRHTHLMAILAVFILCITPEFMGQSALTASNPVAACYLLISLGFFDQYLKTEDNRTFIISLIALSFTIWTRTEAVIFAVPMGILLISKSDIRQTIRKLTALGGFTLIPFAAWQLFIKTLSASPTALPVIKKLFFDAERLSDLLNQMKNIMLNTEFYALGFHLMVICLVTNLIFYKKAVDIRKMSFILISAFVLYIWVYYQLDTEYKIYHKGSWIGSGFKRGLFYFLPIGCYYISGSYLMLKLFKIN